MEDGNGPISVDDDAMMTNADEDKDNSADNDDVHDDTPVFIDMQDAVEVQVDEENRPMEDDNAMEDDAVGDTEGAAVQPDDSKHRFTSHTDCVYTVAAAIDTQTGQLNVLSGGGDDKSFLYKIPSTTGTTTTPSASSTTTIQPIPYAFQDTVSSVAYNWEYVSDPTDTKTPRLAAVGSYDGTILLYDTTSASEQQTPIQPKLKLEGPSDVEWMAFHPKGGTVLLVGSGDASVWMYHLPLNRCLQVFVGHENAVTCGRFTPDGKWAISASSDGTLRIWAPKTGMSKHVFRFGSGSDGGAPAGLTCMATGGGADAALVIVGGEDGQAHVCHIGTKKVVATLRHFEASEMATSGNERDEDDVEHPMSVEAVGFCPAQPTWCATGGVDGKLKIWDLARDGGQLRHVCTTNDGLGSAADSITRLRWHPTFPLVFTAHISGKIQLWDARSGVLVHSLYGGQEQINDMDVQFSPMSQNIAFIVTASDDKAVRVFELDVNAALQRSVTTS